MPVLPLAFDLQSPAWLKSLRWVALSGITLTILAADWLIGLKVDWPWISAILVGLAIWNFSLPWLEEIYSVSNRAYVMFQIIVDLIALTTILWFCGGLLNPFTSFYIFHVMIAGLLLDRKSTISVACLAVTLLLILLAAEPMILQGKEIHLYDSPLWMGLPVALIFLIVFTTAFILGFMHRLERSHSESKQREKMAAMGRLVSGLAHELGTPLNTILLLAKDLQDSAPANDRKDLETIAAQAKRCGDLVGLLLGYSRSVFTSNKDDLVNIELWLNEIFSNVELSIAEKKYRRASFQVISHLPSESIVLPELALRQVFSNLLKNSLQAIHEEHGFLEVEVSQVAQEICFRVKDNGIGFSHEAEAQAFEAFFSTKTYGDGLGLYISYHLVEQIAGRIRIAKELQYDGAVVEVLLPVSQVSLRNRQKEKGI